MIRLVSADEENIMFSEEKARRIAEDFLSRYNPTDWNGEGVRPKEFKAGMIETYDIDSVNGNELDISFEYLDEDEADTNGWTHYCELRDKETGDLMIPLHGYGIDSIQNLIDTIMDICSEEN